MKLRVLISILFIITTTFASIHEIEHITGEHESSSCPICMLSDHLVSADTPNISQHYIQILQPTVKIQTKTIISYTKKNDIRF